MEKVPMERIASIKAEERESLRFSRKANKLCLKWEFRCKRGKG